MKSRVLLLAVAVVLACLMLASCDGDGTEKKPRVIYDDSEPINSPSSIPKRRFVKQEHYYYELAAIGCLLLYAVNMLVGRINNDRIARAWIAAFGRPEGIFHHNFHLVGAGKGTGDASVLYKETSNTYKFYASGRRYCVSLTADIDLLARQDLLSMVWYLISPREELINIEVQMNENSMPPIVLAVAIPRIARTLPKDCDDLKTYAKQLNEVPKDKLARWPSGLKVIAEQSTVFYEMFADPKLEHIFSQENFESGAMKYFRSLHFTSEGTGESETSPKSVLRFSFALPPAAKMDQLSLLMALVPFFIDLVGSYTMPGDLRKRASDNRARVAAEAFRKDSEQRMEAAQQRKMEKLQAEKAKAAKMGPEAKQKWEEKQQKKELRRRQAGKMVKMG